MLAKTRNLLKPDGRFALSNWQFLNSERLRERIQPWERIRLSAAEVDEGDHLLDWRSGGEGLRYAHHFNEDELAELAQESGFQVLETFYSDGENGRLGMYQIWEKHDHLLA
jgi:(p)ppGpp synthase/HD superfamily hydrolase